MKTFVLLKRLSRLTLSAFALSAPLYAAADGYPDDYREDGGRVPAPAIAGAGGSTVNMGDLYGAPVAGPNVASAVAEAARSAAARPTAMSTAPNQPADVLVQPDQTATIAVSNKFVNRIYCPDGVGDVFHSTEKPMEVTSADGGHVFVKFLVMRDPMTMKDQLVSDPADLHVVCGGKVYTMILQPRPMDSQTIRLGNPQLDAFMATAKEWGALPLEEKIKRLTLTVYQEQSPPGFQRRRVSDDHRRFARMFDDVIVQGVWEVLAPGTGLKATEYSIVITRPMTIDARAFLRPEFGQVVGITVDPPVLDETTRRARLIVVERSIGK